MSEATAEWLTQKERGAIWGIRAVLFMATLFGRGPTRILVRFIALYYALFDRDATTASRTYLAKVHGRPARFREVYAHILRFAQTTLDRLFMLQGAHHHFVVTREGNHHLQKLTREKRGAILLGAHLGSFEAMRMSGAEERFPITIVGHFENAKMINALLSQLNPELNERVLHIGNSPLDFALTLRSRVESGEMVAMMGDRIGLNDKTVTARFFGEKALFPAGPFLIAATLRCPVYLVFGIYREPNIYELSCMPFKDRIHLPRNDRMGALESIVQEYADALEEKCRSAPDNWFNFFDFWGGADT